MCWTEREVDGLDRPQRAEAAEDRRLARAYRHERWHRSWSQFRMQFAGTRLVCMGRQTVVPNEEQRVANLQAEA